MAYCDLQERLAATGYVAGDQLAMALHLALTLGRPLLLEGEVGVGKTEIVKALATNQNTRLIGLQCYEGLDAAAAIYEWNYQRQLLAIRAASETSQPSEAIEERIFTERYLLRRPLLEAILQETQPVLLIDEIDRAEAQIVGFVQALRQEDLEKRPGIAETLDWLAALSGLSINDLAAHRETVQATLVCLLKTSTDQARITPEVTARLIGRAA